MSVEMLLLSLKTVDRLASQYAAETMLDMNTGHVTLTLVGTEIRVVADTDAISKNNVVFSH